MKKICVFSQTYGNRQSLFLYHNINKIEIDFRNKFDLNIYSFHNCDDLYVENLKKEQYFKNIKDIEFIYYKNISYPLSFKETLLKIKQMGFDYLIFIQDDCFILNEKLNLNFIVDFIKKENFKMLNISYKLDDIIDDVDNEKIRYKKNNEFLVYESNTFDFAKKTFSFNDSPYVANLDFLINEIYDENYFSLSNIWDAEKYLNEKMKKQKKERLITNLNIYKTMNIVGINTWNKENEIKELEKLKNKYD